MHLDNRPGIIVLETCQMAIKKSEVCPGVIWLDVVQPTKPQIAELAHDYHINGHVLQDCLDPDHLPKYEQLGNATFIIIRLFSAPKSHVDTIQEMTEKVAVFFADRFLLTIHDDALKSLPTLEQACTPGNERKTIDIVAQIIIEAIRSFEAPAFNLSAQVEAYEKTVLLKRTRATLLSGLYYLKRQASASRKVLVLTTDLIHVMDNTEADKSVLQDTRDLHTKLLLLYETSLDDVANLLTVYLSLAAQRTNDVMKLLTIFSVFFMPLTFIVGVYGMNFQYMPELRWAWGYPAVWIVMVCVTIATFIWMRKRGLV